MYEWAGVYKSWTGLVISECPASVPHTPDSSIARPRMPRLYQSLTFLGQVTSRSTKLRLAWLASPFIISHPYGSNGFFVPVEGVRAIRNLR